MKVETDLIEFRHVNDFFKVIQRISNSKGSDHAAHASKTLFIRLKLASTL